MDRFGKTAGVVGLLVLACMARVSAAFEIGTPLELLQLRCDNTLRDNAAWRVQDQDPPLDGPLILRKPSATQLSGTH